MSDLLARLIAAGTPAELVGEVAMLLAEQKVLEKRRAHERERKAKQRAEKGECHVTSREGTGQAGTSQDNPPLDKEKSPTPPKEINPPLYPPVNPDGLTPPAIDEPENRGKPDDVAEVWNELAAKLGKPKVRDLTPSRRKALRGIIASYETEDVVTVFDRIERSAFLRGDTGWHGCNFDWVFKKANFQKILEGNYDQ